jgi:homoserine kinase type II
MVNVFVLQHVHTGDEGVEDVKFIGVYSSREKAEAAVRRLSAQPGFSDTADGFHIDEYQVDQDQWSEGYVVAGVS